MISGRARTIGCLQARSFYLFAAHVLALCTRCHASCSPNAQAPVVQAKYIIFNSQSLLMSSDNTFPEVNNLLMSTVEPGQAYPLRFYLMNQLKGCLEKSPK